MEVVKKINHLVLVHGMSQGAWYWYKLIPLLKKAGHKVTALDMAASGVNTKKIEDVYTFEDYSKPLLDFMDSLPVDDKVILVGHSFGGMNCALAMEKFPHKISSAVFLTAFVPDTVHPPSFTIEKFCEAPSAGWLDSEFSTYGPPEEPLTRILIGPQMLRILANLCPEEDYELAKSLQRPSSLFIPDLAKAKKFSNEGYGSVRRVYIICKEDKGIAEAFVRWMIENSGVTEVKEIEGADHMPMLSQPQLLCDCLVRIASDL